MTWPTTQAAESSAAAAWGNVTALLQTADAECVALRALATANNLHTHALRRVATNLKTLLAQLIANGSVPGLQEYGRQWSGRPTFSLAGEGNAVITLLNALLAEVRALHNAQAQASIAVDGTVTEPNEGPIPAAACVALIAACVAVEAQIE